MKKDQNILEKTDQIWADDRLTRKDDARLLIDFLRARYKERLNENRTGAYVLNLDASWGDGKTFFLERLCEQLKLEGHIVAYVNAWRDDTDGEPMTAVMAELRASVEPYFSQSNRLELIWNSAQSQMGAIAVAIGKGVVGQILKKLSGEGAREAAEILENSALESDLIRAAEASIDKISDDISDIADRKIKSRIEAYRLRQKSIHVFKEKISLLIQSIEREEGKLPPIFVVLDELDRCRPTYAINMLEETKHLFDVGGLVFIVATDTAQLAHSVRAIYGQNFAAERYLLRFFNRRYSFGQASIEAFMQAMFNAHPNLMARTSPPLTETHASCFSGIAQRFALSLRDAEQCFEMLRNFVSVWDKNVAVQLTLVIPLIILFHVKETEKFEKLSNLEDISFPDNQYKYDIILKRTDNFGREIQPEAVSFNHVLQVLVRMAKSGFSLRSNWDGSGEVNRWAGNVMRDEYSQIHQSTSISGKIEPSVMADYGKIIRSISRISGPLG